MEDSYKRIPREDSSTGNSLRNRSWSHGLDSEDDIANESGNALLNEANEPRESHSVSMHCNSCSAEVATFTEEKMRRKLRFFFMNPIEKWQAKRRFPYKFIVQLVKILLVTIQLCLFANNNYKHVNYTWDNRITFSHLFLKGWDSAQEVPAYPPATGPLAVYKRTDFYDAIDYALHGYYNIDDAIGSYSYIAEDNSIGPVTLCLYQFKEGTIFGFNESYVFDNEIIEKCVNISLETYDTFKTSHNLLQNINVNVNFSALVRAHLKFMLKTVNLKAAGRMTPPDCFRFNVKIDFDNRDFDGQMLLSLDAEPQKLQCKGDTRYIIDNHIESALRTLQNLLVILICAVSLLLCSRSIYTAQLLKFETINFFKRTYGKSLSLEGRLEFLNCWYIMIIINDLLIIFGSAMKERIEREHSGRDHWSICSICLGTGNLLMWFGVLRYLGFFKTYNVVILTLKKAAPKVARYLLCAILIYAGFTFCGWLVLGPYNMKFRSLATTSECLFALINGDDMFATFSITSSNSPVLWWYSRIYLYTFISLYIYVVLSLFISVIMDAYDTIKIYYRDGFPMNDLQTFIAPCTDDASSGLYRDDSESDLMKLFYWFCCCRKRPFYESFSDSSIEESGVKNEQTCDGTICV